MLNNINLRRGKITYDDFAIDINTPLSEQDMSLQQDLMQIGFSNNYLIDLGWYPMLNPEGKLKIRVIKDRDWRNPVMARVIPGIQTFYQQLDEVIEFVDNLARQEREEGKANKSN